MVTPGFSGALGHPKYCFLPFLAILKRFKIFFQNRNFYLQKWFLGCRRFKQLKMASKWGGVKMLLVFQFWCYGLALWDLSDSNPSQKGFSRRFLIYRVDFLKKKCFSHPMSAFVRKSLLKWAKKLEKNEKKYFFLEFFKNDRRVHIWSPRGSQVLWDTPNTVFYHF